ncbi:hypothetical protein [Nocardioides perillae]|uniref:Uncharacterized protein n=1 Tax=Nocardioides perillae TaxID=1119534 RepID=A0A7Y9RPC7_9ACTN|nr:hypothetical protein [Nocardioides perillae]NYG54081.1 hypothetical protein [Nocardioides perillae]
MDSTMTSRPVATGLVAHWVPVTDARGRTRLEMHWGAPHAPAPVGAHQHAA